MTKGREFEPGAVTRQCAGRGAMDDKGYFSRFICTFWDQLSVSGEKNILLFLVKEGNDTFCF